MKVHRNRKFFLYYLALLSLTASGLYILSMGSANTFFALKISFVYAFLVLALLSWFAIEIYKNISLSAFKISQRCDNLEKILLDVRDGTKRFYREKRRARRINTKDRISAKITNKDIERLLKVLNISHFGALLRTGQDVFYTGEKVDLDMYLPYFPQSIDIRSRVVRVRPLAEKKDTDFDVGVEYLDMNPIDRKKLTETIDLLDKAYQEESL